MDLRVYRTSFPIGDTAEKPAYPPTNFCPILMKLGLKVPFGDTRVNMKIENYFFPLVLGSVLGHTKIYQKCFTGCIFLNDLF